MYLLGLLVCSCLLGFNFFAFSFFDSTLWLNWQPPLPLFILMPCLLADQHVPAGPIESILILLHYSIPWTWFLHRLWPFNRNRAFWNILPGILLYSTGIYEKPLRQSLPYDCARSSWSFSSVSIWSTSPHFNFFGKGHGRTLHPCISNYDSYRHSFNRWREQIAKICSTIFA